MWDPPEDDLKKFSYIMFQAEECPTTGTLHYQGYLETIDKMTRKAVMTSLWGTKKGKHFWCAPSKGTAKDNMEYCSKSKTRVPGIEPYQRGSPFELIEKTTKKRSRGEEITREAFQLDKLPRVTEDNAWLIANYGRRIKDMLHIKALQDAPPRVIERAMECILHIGPKETGKSTAMWAGATLTDTYNVEPANGKLWWDDYTYQNKIILDEFKGEIPARILNKILDKWPLTLEIKGDKRHAHWTKVEVASNYPIKDWYACPIEQATVARRFHKCLLYSKLGVPPVLADPITGIAIPQAK